MTLSNQSYLKRGARRRKLKVLWNRTHNFVMTSVYFSTRVRALQIKRVRRTSSLDIDKLKKLLLAETLEYRKNSSWVSSFGTQANRGISKGAAAVRPWRGFPF